MPRSESAAELIDDSGEKVVEQISHYTFVPVNNMTIYYKAKSKRNKSLPLLKLNEHNYVTRSARRESFAATITNTNSVTRRCLLKLRRSHGNVLFPLFHFVTFRTMPYITYGFTDFTGIR
jgi:hypothetical protein